MIFVHFNTDSHCSRMAGQQTGLVTHTAFIELFWNQNSIVHYIFFEYFHIAELRRQRLYGGLTFNYKIFKKVILGGVLRECFS